MNAWRFLNKLSAVCDECRSGPPYLPAAMTERQAPVSKYPVKIANQWLSTAKDGFCAATTGPGNCEVDNMGSFAIAPHERDYFKTWTRAAQLCLQKCSECRRCGMVQPWCWYHTVLLEQAQ